MLVGLLVLGLGVPLAAAGAAAATSQLFADRLGDTTRFAALAQRAVTDDDTGPLSAELRRYEELYGITAAWSTGSGRVLAASRPDAVAGEERRVQLALVGQRSEPPGAALALGHRADAARRAGARRRRGPRRGGDRLADLARARRRARANGRCWRGPACIARRVAALVALPLVRWILAPVRAPRRGHRRGSRRRCGPGAPPSRWRRSAARRSCAG